MRNESEMAEDLIRSAYRRRVAQIASAVDVESTLDAVRGRGSGRVRGRAVPRVRRPLTALVAGFVLAFIVIGGAGLLSVSVNGTRDVAGGGDVPNTGSTDPAVTTTPESEDGGIHDWADGAYRVVPATGLSTVPLLGDPSATAPAIGELSGDDMVNLTGEAATVDGVAFLQVASGETDGWIEARYVAPPDAWLAGFDTLDCEPDGSAFLTENATMPASIGPHVGPAAGHVLDVIYHESEECERLVVVLGAGEGVDGEGRWMGDPAAWVPEGTEVRSGTSVVSVSVPGVGEVRPIASTLVFGDVLGLASRSVDGAILDFVFESNRRAAVQILENPARVVIDLRPAPTGSGLDRTPSRGGPFVLLPVQTDVQGAGVELPVTVSGWGRPNEATAVAELRSAAASPGSGELVEALFETDSAGPQRTSRYVFATADWVLWSPFSLTIDDLPPGDYELFVGENTPAESDSGVYVRFSVAG